MNYITIKDAAIYLGVTKQAVYQAIWRRTLKAKKHEGRQYTTQDWLDEYVFYWRSKQEHSMFNGQKVYDKDRGHYSIKMVADELGVKEQMLYDMVKEGKIKSFKKGCHIIISKEELELAKSLIIKRHCKSA